MSKPFDATMNSLIDIRPEDWAGYLAARLGIPFGDVGVIDSDLSATVQADRQSIQSERGKRILDTPRIGSADGFLNAGVSFAPLALLTNEATKNPRVAYDSFRDRLRKNDVSENVAREVYGLSSILCGLRYDETQIGELFMGGHNVLEDSVIYQSLVRRGEAKGLSQGRVLELKNILARQGNRKFGAPGQLERDEFQTFTDLERLEHMADRIFDATSWADLLATV